MQKAILASLLLAFASVTASAIPVLQLTPSSGALSTFYIEKNGTGPGNGNDPTSNLYRLNTYFLPSGTVTIAGAFKFDSGDLPGSVGGFTTFTGLSGFSYAVAHYGNGAPFDGNIGAWQLNGNNNLMITSQGLSTLDLFGPRLPPAVGNSVPEGGLTAAMLGLVLAGLGLLRRAFLRS